MNQEITEQKPNTFFKSTTEQLDDEMSRPNDLPDDNVDDGNRQRLEQLFSEQVLNMNEQVIYIPIRHHSPGCSHHLLRIIEQYKPQAILIEGPEAGNPLIPVLADPATQSPVSLYYTYEHQQRRGAFYFPMLDYSPEYVAIREAARLNIPASFIDLNYRKSVQEQEQAQENSKLSYQSEMLLTGSSFIERLTQTLHCRNFDELWERWFESGAAQINSADYMRDVFVYCSLSRLCYTDQQLESEGTLARERNMIRHITAAKQQFDRIVVVTGGFHTYGLLPEYQYPAEQEILHSDDLRNEQIYPMVYTFEEADRLNGYASGMPYVAYYDQLWQWMQKENHRPGEQTSIRLLSLLMRSLRKEDEAVSTSDAIEAYGLLQGLAVLRNKPDGGVYELIDSVTSCFIKGEHTLAASRPLQSLEQLLTGNKIGQVAANSFAVPIVEDFKKQAAAHKLQIHTTGKHKKVLDVYTKSRHRELSRLFHCMEFLDTGWAVRESGPDWVEYRDINLVRETWTYSYSSYTEARLIENSIYGGTIIAAATRRAEEKVAALAEQDSGESAQWLLRALLMGLEHTAVHLLQHTQQALRLDGSFLSLSHALTMLERIYEHRRLLGLRNPAGLLALLKEAYHYAVAAMDTLHHTHPDDQLKVIQALKQLYMITESRPLQLTSESLLDRLTELLAAPELPPSLEGVSAALLSQAGRISQIEIIKRARSYMRGTSEQMKHTAAYLQGVFAAARDAFLYDDKLLEEMNNLFARLTHEDFVQMIPELRLAFTFFTPAETAVIAGRVAGLFQLSEQQIQQTGIEESLLKRISVQDQAVRAELERWKLF